MPSLICAECGHANGGEARFCEACGSSLALRCPSCGAEVSPTARFCSSCGSPVAEAPAPAGALKVVSVVFSDVVGSTALQETLEAESVRRVMARFYEAMREVVERHGGAIQKFIGDAVVAVFGVPSVSEDDAVRAVRCAVAMTAALGELNDELEQTWGVRLQTRTGVNTGELAISGEGIFVGDTMNTAARLEQAADAGEVLLGEATWRLVRHEVEVEEIAPLELKGKAGPVRVWRVESLQTRGPAAAEAPLVGRASELERLRLALDQATAARGCRLVTVIGSPGLGKSRLAAEFARSLEDQAMVLEGHCEQSGEGITFLPVAEVLRAAASIADDDPPEQVVAKLTEIVPEGSDRGRVVARVAGLLGAGPPAAPEETFWGVRTVLESLARERPLVVVLDDVHWGQPMFLDLIEHLVEWARDAAILLVALARPELREVRGALAAVGRRATDVIELDPLGPDQSRELVGGLLGQVDVPDELLARILETTEGNPLFLGELLRMLVDEGSLERSGDVWVAAGGAEAVQVPPTIQALLTARIERLRADERSVVERAAVIGKQFYRGAVAELVTPPVRSGIDEHLETLRRKDMVEPEGTYWIDEPVFRFHHVLIRDAAYHLLLKEARAELHERFADWLETKAGELVGEHEEVIAYHLEQSHEYRRQLGPLDERGKAIGARAAERLASAGRRALAREDLAAAANLLQRSLDREAGVAEDEVMWDLGEALLSAGDTAGVGPVVNRLSGPRADVLGAQLALMTGTGSLEETLERVSAATAALAAAGDDAAEAKGHHVTAQVQAQLGRVADVETSLDQALLAARKADDRRRITAVLAAAPRAALWGPSPVVRASGRCLDVVRILRMTPGNRHVEAVALRCQAVLEAMRGRADAAREILAGGRATLEELGLTLELHELAMHAGIVESLAAKPDAAENLLRSARDGFAALGLSVSAAQAAALLARALVEQGRDDEALPETEYAEQHAGGDLKTTITWLGVRAEAIARRGHTDEALELARRAAALAEPTDALADKADANMALARVLRDAGDAEAGRRAADAARALYQRKDHAVGVQRASQLAARPAPESAPPTPHSPAAIDDPELADLVGRYVKGWEERDAEALASLYAEDCVTIDHRAVGWAERSGHEANLEWFKASLALSDDFRVHVDRVISSAPGLIAFTMSFRGSSAETGGEAEIALGRVVAFREGLITRVEIFEPDAEISMRSCFEDLRGRVLLGDRVPERCYERFVDCFGRHDREGLAEIWAADIAFIDHRQIAWEELHDLDGLLKLADSAWQMAHDVRCVVDEVIACDDRALAIRCRYVGSGSDGGGPIEISAGTVNVTEHGRVVRSEWFDHDDREGMLARYRELGGTLDVLGDRPPERLIAEFKRRFDAHDLDGLVELYHEDWTLTDHRQFGGDVIHGPRTSLESVFAGSPDVRVDVEEVIACDDQVIALEEVYRGTAEEAAGGEFELRFGLVSVVEDGLARSTEIFDPDDRIAIMARWRELHGLGLLGDLSPQRFWARWIDCYARQDADRVLELIDEDYTFVDRRAIGWEEQRGPEEHLKVFKSGASMWRGGRFAIDEVLACDERVCAVRGTYVGAAADGGGQMEISVGYVGDFTDGGFRRVEQFEHDDTEGMLARYREFGGTLDVLGDRPPERWFAAFKRRFDAHDLDGLSELYAEEFTLKDRRSFGMELIHGPAGAAELYSSGFAASSDARIDIEEVIACDDRVIALRATYRGTSSETGGDFELPWACVMVVEGGLARRNDSFDPDDRIAVMARWRELHGLGLLGDRPPERELHRFIELWGQRDLDALKEHWPEDIVLVDHRLLAWEEVNGREGLLQLSESAWKVSPDIRLCVEEVMACDDRVLAVRCVYVGTGAEGAGMMELPIGFVNIVEDGRLLRTEVFDPDHREALLGRYRELGGTPAVLDDRPAVRVMEEVRRLQNARDYDRLVELVAEDFYMVDHRALGWPEVHEREHLMADLRSVYDASPSVRLEYDEILACDENVLVTLQAWRGSGLKAGEHEVRAGAVHLIKDGRWAGIDFYEPDDREAMLARFAELSGERMVELGDRPSERLLAEWVRLVHNNDAEGVADLCAEDHEFVDHRKMGWDAFKGREGTLELNRSIYANVPDVQIRVEEVLACDDSRIAVAFTAHGEGAHGSGAWTMPVNALFVSDGDHLTRLEFFEPGDREATMARYAELGETISVLGERPSQRVLGEVQRILNTRNYDRLGELVADDWYFVDHRALGWEEGHGRDDCVAIMRSMFDASPQVRFDLDDVLAADDRVIVVHAAVRGHGVKAGEHEVVTGAVYLIEHGFWVGVDFYEPDDRHAMIARYAELGGGAGPLGDRPPERFFKKWLPLSAANDAESLSAMLAEDFVRVDHRSIGWEPLRGREANVALWRSAYESAEHVRQEVDEVLACDDRVIAWRFSWCGVAAGAAGEFAASVGQVCVIEDGLYRSCDQYDTDDRNAMIARYVELGGGLSKLGDTASERMFAEYARRYARRDLDGVVDLMSDDYAQVDHRTLGWTEIGKEQNAAEMRSVWAGSTDIRPEVDDVLAADDRALACICTYRGSGDASIGGGQFEYPVGFLLVTDGQRSSRVEWFNPDDREALLARYEELSGRPSDAKLTGAAELAPLRAVTEFVERYNARDLDGVTGQYSDSAVIVDHRPIGGDPICGRQGIRAFIASLFEISPDHQLSIDEVIACDQRVIAYRSTHRGSVPDLAGGVAELSVALVKVFEDGAFVRDELFEPDDLAAIVGSYVELGGGLSALGDRPPESFFRQWTRHFAAGDLDALRAMYTDDAWLLDHRPIGYFGELRGRDQMVEMARSTLEANPHVRWEIDEVLACDDRVLAARCSWLGQGIKAGEFLVPWGFVAVVEAGRLVSIEIYTVDDRPGMLARYEELSAPAGNAERLAFEYLRLVEARDLEAIREMLADEIEVADHRAVAAPPGRGPDAALELTRSALSVTSELRFEIDELLTSNERTVALRGSWTGTAADGQGELSLPMAIAVTVDGDKLTALDLYEHDDVEAIRARTA